MNNQLKKEIYKGQNTYLLQNDHISLNVAPHKGMMICRIDVFSQTVIDMDLERLINGQTTGLPILFPTPNRVSGDGFVFQKEMYKLCYKGEPILLHGAALRFSFEVIGEEVTVEIVAITGEFNIKKGSPSYEYFPFECKLVLTIKVMKDSVYIAYTVMNLSEKALPFGFGIHPFFKKQGKTLFKISVDQVYKCDDHFYPNGELLPSVDLPFDVCVPTDIESYNFNHVFTGIQDFKKTIEIGYVESNLSLTISTSEDFGHIVVYTPQNADFFCIENQTCSADCHNLYQKSCNTTGLQIIAPGKEKSGNIQIKFSNNRYKTI